jgi:hypothetical protein
MSVLNYIVDKLKSGIITFINAVILANRDYPYHDTLVVTDADPPSGYAVGKNQVDARGSQSKLFVSKSTLIMSTEDATIQFNDANNVLVPLVAGVWYEFKSNIFQVFYGTPSTDKGIYFYFEGVLPDEQRGAE